MARYDQELIDAVANTGWLDRVRSEWSSPAAGGCWEWRRGRNAKGYGTVRVRTASYTESYQAHRITWIAANRALPPDGQHVDHLCENKACVNPEHLQPVTAGENYQRLLRRAAMRAEPTAIRMGRRGVIRIRYTSKGEPRYGVRFRDYVDGRMYQRTRTFDTLESAEAFRSALRERAVYDLVARPGVDALGA